MFRLLKNFYMLLNLTVFKLVCIICFCFFVSTFQVATSIYLSYLIDSYVSIGSVYIDKTIVFLVILFVFIILKVLLKYILNIVSIKVEYNFNKIFIGSISDLSENIAIIMNRIEKFRKFLDNSLESIFYIPILFVLTFIGAYILDFYICILILPIICISILIDIKLSPILLKSSKEFYDLENNILKFQKNIIENKEQILLNDLDTYVINLHNKKQENLFDLGNKLTKSKQISYTPALLNEYMPTIVLILISSIRVYYFNLSYGKFLGLLGLIVGISLPFTKFLRILISLKSYKFLIEDLSKIKIYKKSGLEKLSDLSNINYNNFNFENAIEVLNLDFKYKSSNYIFKDINLLVNEGMKVAVIGETGSGKTTFLKLILGLNSGLNNSVIKIFGLNILNNKRLIWDKIGYVDNNNYLFNRSLIYNITFKEELSKEELIFLKNILEKLNILDFLNENFVIQEFGSNLSGGQKLKICIARSLFRNPKLLILDEPTASLDEISEKIFCEILKEIDITTLIVTHKRRLIDICDEVYEIKDGKLLRRNNEYK